MGVIHLRKTIQGVYDCFPSHSIKKDGKKIKWHCKDSEFKIIFDGENPFDNTPNKTFESSNKKIEREAKVHGDPIAYEYKVELLGPTGRVVIDPGLIVRR